MEKHKKVLFVQKVDDEFCTEGLWCIGKDGNFIIDNIPFIAKRVSLGDTIKAEFDEEEQAFYFEDFVAVSGNTTVRVYVKVHEDIQAIRQEFIDMDCSTEVLLQKGILAINISAEQFYRPIKDHLEAGEEKGRWVYEESCLAHE